MGCWRVGNAFKSGTRRNQEGTAAWTNGKKKQKTKNKKKTKTNKAIQSLIYYDNWEATREAL